PIARSFPPGSEWIYLKLYTGASNCDQLLRGVISPLVKRLKKEHAIDRWFFLRYGDPEWHLRIRFHASDRRSTSVILRAFQKQIEHSMNSSIWRMELDTYEREIE